MAMASLAQRLAQRTSTAPLLALSQKQPGVCRAITGMSGRASGDTALQGRHVLLPVGLAGPSLQLCCLLVGTRPGDFRAAWDLKHPHLWLLSRPRSPLCLHCWHIPKHSSQCGHWASLALGTTTYKGSL